MKVAYLIMGHRDPAQILRLIHVLRDSGAFFVIHIDKRASDDVFAPLKEYAATHPESFSPGDPVLLGRLRHRLCHDRVRANRCSGWTPLRLRDSFIGPGLSHQKCRSNRGFPDQNKGAEFIESFPLSKPNRWTSHSGYFQAMNRVRYWTFFIRSRTFHLPIARKFPFGWEPYGGSQWWGLSRDASCISISFCARTGIRSLFQARPHP